MITRSNQHQENSKDYNNNDNTGIEVSEVIMTEKTQANQSNEIHSPQKQQTKHRHSLSSYPTTNHIEQNFDKLKSNRSTSFSVQTSNSSRTRRRSSFLSQSMLSDEKHMVYELYNYSSNSPRYSITLSESQGFNWNQDLFASQYQQKTAVIHSHYKYNDVFDEDDDMDMEYEPRTRAYSATNGGIEKVEVIDIIVDE